jgi:hypothetical protein
MDKIDVLLKLSQLLQIYLMTKTPNDKILELLNATTNILEIEILNDVAIHLRDAKNEYKNNHCSNPNENE